MSFRRVPFSSMGLYGVRFDYERRFEAGVGLNGASPADLVLTMLGQSRSQQNPDYWYWISWVEERPWSNVYIGTESKPRSQWEGRPGPLSHGFLPL